MSRIETALDEIIAYAKNDAHGYELHSRRYDYGTDCAGLVRLYAAITEGVSVATYPDFHTWDEEDTLESRGWLSIPFTEAARRRGDVLLKVDVTGGGHTVVYLGDEAIVGAEGNWDGRAGDSSGTEVCVRSYYPYGYQRILRPPEVGMEKKENELYRLYNEYSGLHLFTASHEEASTLAGLGWKEETCDIACVAEGISTFRLYNPYDGNHIQTQGVYEVGALVIEGWTFEGEAWKSPASGRAVYRLYNPGNGDHLLTVAGEEMTFLLDHGWGNDGIVCKG